MPDRTNMRKLEALMRFLASVPQSNPKHALAQERLAQARELFRAQAATDAETRKLETLAEAKGVNDTKVSAGAAFGLGFARGALGGDAYTREPENKANLRLENDPEFAASLINRQRVEDAALIQQPAASHAGEVSAVAVPLTASGFMGARALGQAIKQTTPREFFGVPKWLKPNEAVSPPAMTRPGVTTQTVVSQPKPADGTPTVTTAPAKAPAAPRVDRTELAARERIIRQQGFSAADAREMAASGTKVPREALERMLGKKLPGKEKWI